MHVNVSAVSYTNTKPFIYGIEHAGIQLDMDVTLDIPSDCAEKVMNGKADLGLVPVAALLDIPDYRIITDYCIGTTGAVNSVFIFSKKPIETIDTLRLDKQSRTSNNLARVLLQRFWKREVLLTDADDADAFVEIGDRTFGKAAIHPYAYDLGEAWWRLSGLPFAFAVWAANKELPAEFIADFNRIMKYGLDNREKLLALLPVYPGFDIRDYLMNRLDYTLDNRKREAITLFHQFIHELEGAEVAEK